MQGSDTVRWVAIVMMVIIAAFSGYTTYSQNMSSASDNALRNLVTLQGHEIVKLKVEVAIWKTTVEGMAVDIGSLTLDIREIKDLMIKFLTHVVSD